MGMLLKREKEIEQFRYDSKRVKPCSIRAKRRRICKNLKKSGPDFSFEKMGGVSGHFTNARYKPEPIGDDGMA
jgi:hypothetical protein